MSQVAGTQGQSIVNICIYNMYYIYNMKSIGIGTYIITHPRCDYIF